VLLVLDDTTGHDQVRPLLPGTGGSTVLVTSRHRLTALDDAAVIDLDTLPEQDAVRLLVRISGRADLHTGDAGVAEITRLCGGLPLAIGMLARQLHHHPAWTPAGLAADLAATRDRLDLMQSENVSVAAVFDLSYQNLTAGQRRLFRCLGLHPGPDIDCYAAAALANISVAAARGQLMALYDQHLITEPATGRYRLHDLLREHARTLAASGNPHGRETAIGRVLDYYLHAARAAAEHIPHWLSAPGPPAPGHAPASRPAMITPGEAFGWMEAERANLYAVAEHTVETARPTYTIAMSVAMAGFLESVGPWDKAISLQEAAVAAARQINDKAGLARNLNLLGGMYAITGDGPTGAATFAQALEIYRDLGDAGGQAESLSGLANLHTVAGDYQLAVDEGRQAMILFAEAGLHRGQAEVLCALGTLHERDGNPAAAAACFRQALRLSTDLGDPWGQLNALINLGIFEREAGDYAAAEPHLRQALDLARHCQDRYRQAYIVGAIGVLQRLTGNYQAAAASLGRALEVFREIGQIDGIAFASNYLGLLQQLNGDYQTAAASHRRALAIYRDCGRRPGQADALNSLGELFIRTGDPAEARKHHTQALSIARDLPAPVEEARALEGIGSSHFHDNNPSEASDNFQQALEIYERLGNAGTGRIREMLASCRQSSHPTGDNRPAGALQRHIADGPSEPTPSPAS
jgi:tetratricopeptide (TPR) repeat protein